MNIKLYCKKHTYTELMVHEIRSGKQEVAFYVLECTACQHDYNRILEKLKEENRELKKKTLMLDALKIYHEHRPTAIVGGTEYVKVNWPEVEVLMDHPRFEKEAIKVQYDSALSPNAFLVPKSIVDDWNKSWKKKTIIPNEGETD